MSAVMSILFAAMSVSCVFADPILMIAEVIDIVPASVLLLLEPRLVFCVLVSTMTFVVSRAVLIVAACAAPIV